MDVVDHGPAFVASVIRYIGMQLADVADPTGDLLLHQAVSQLDREPPPYVDGQGEALLEQQQQPNVVERGSRSARLPLPTQPEDVVRLGCGSVGGGRGDLA